MENGFNFKYYGLLSALSCGLITTYSYLIHEDFYSSIAYLASEKISLGIFYNFFFACFLLLGKLLLKIFVGQLRRLELEQLIENGSGFVLDSVVFIIISNPTLNGKHVPTFGLIKFLCIIVSLKTFHVIAQIRVTYIFEVGRPDLKSLLRLCSLFFTLLVADIFAISVFFKSSSNSSTIYMWLFFECFGMCIICIISILKYAVQLIDMRLENGWASKAAFIFYLDLINDILGITVFLVFVSVYYVHDSSGVPLFVTVDVIQIVKTLYTRLKSFHKYRKLTRNLNERFPDATLEEIEEVDTCVICRDALYEGSKKLPCSHIFHFDCLKAWFVQQQNCPTCRQEVTAEDVTSVADDVQVDHVNARTYGPSATNRSLMEPDVGATIMKTGRRFAGSYGRALNKNGHRLEQSSLASRQMNTNTTDRMDILQLAAKMVERCNNEAKRYRKEAERLQYEGDAIPEGPAVRLLSEPSLFSHHICSPSYLKLPEDIEQLRRLVRDEVSAPLFSQSLPDFTARCTAADTDSRRLDSS